MTPTPHVDHLKTCANFILYRESFLVFVLDSQQAKEKKMCDRGNQCEGFRYESFHNWPLRFPSPKSLAAAGFYYTGVRDAVACFECNVLITNWLKSDAPMDEHKKHSPFCK